MKPVYRFIETLLRDLSGRASIPSSLGGQLDKLRDGTSEIVFSDPFAVQERNHKTALRLLVWNSLFNYDWGQLAADALLRKHSPIGWRDTFRLVREEELIPDFEYEPPTYVTKAGEQLALEEETRNPPQAGYRIVISPRPIFPRNRDIAAALGISDRHLRTVLGNAYSVLESHELFKVVLDEEY
jgi:hypothetical protein